MINNTFNNKINISDLCTLIRQIHNDHFLTYNSSGDVTCSLYIDTDGNINTVWCYREYNNNYHSINWVNSFDTSTDTITHELAVYNFGFSTASTVATFAIYKLNLANMTYSQRDASYVAKQYTSNGNTTTYLVTSSAGVNSVAYNLHLYASGILTIHTQYFEGYVSSTETPRVIDIIIKPSYYYWDMEYSYAQTQFDVTAENIYGAIAYGGNGIITGTLQQTTNLSRDQVRTRVNLYSDLSYLELNGINNYDF